MERLELVTSVLTAKRGRRLSCGLGAERAELGMGVRFAFQPGAARDCIDMPEAHALDLFFDPFPIPDCFSEKDGVPAIKVRP